MFTKMMVYATKEPGNWVYIYRDRWIRTENESDFLYKVYQPPHTKAILQSNIQDGCGQDAHEFGVNL